MIKKKELYRNLLIKKKERGLKDLLFFNKYILESDEKRRKLIVDHVHGEWTRWYYKSTKRIKMILVPRACFKSTFFTVGRTIQALCADRDSRTLIANATLTNSQKFLSEIKDQLRKNPELERLYGKFYDPKLRWNEGEIDILGKGLGSRESSVTAIGVGGNLVSQHYCLYPETKVMTSNGYKEAKGLRKGLRVLSHDGKFHSIKAVSESTSFSKVSIRPQYQAEYSHFSPNHRVYVYRNGEFEWVRAYSVRLGDMLCVPISKFYNRQPSKVNKRINKLFTELDIWRLIGYWLAEGCYTPAGGQVRLTFSDKEISFVNDVEDIVRKHLKVPVSHRKTKNSTFIVCFSDNDFKEMLNKFGTKSYTKHIPPFALNNYSNRQRELILGYFRGDGCFCRNTVSFSSTSLDLLSGVQIMLAKNGIASGICHGTKEGEGVIMGNNVHIRNAWGLTSTSPLLKVMLGLEVGKFPSKPIRSFFTDRYWVVPVRDIKVTEEESVTYDVQVTETETLYCQGMVVHNSMIIADDLVNLENSSSRYQANKVIDWWKRAFSLLDYDGEMIIIGTRWSYYELYSWIVEKYGDMVDTYIRGAYNPDGSLYFPELLSEEKLEELKSLQGSYVFSAFYLNDPVDEESALIKRSQLKYWGPGDADLPRTLNVFAVCDPAVSQAASADESSIVIVGVDAENSWWVLETRSGRWTVGELIQQLFAVKKQWNPQTMTIEVIGQGQGIMLPIHDEENRRNDYLPLHEITVRPPVKKEIRVRSVLQPRFERGKVFIKRDMYDLEEQIIKFPRGGRDDMIDAMTDVEEISFAPEIPNEPFKSSGSHLQDLLIKEATITPDYEDPFLGGYI